jgi:predicted ATP-dependent endonuclease of OLD family
MRLRHFRIENFRNLRLAECADPPDFMVICGGNGCGKSALLNALMTAKEHAGAYGSFTFDPRAVSADADRAMISMTLEFAPNEREFVKRLIDQRKAFTPALPAFSDTEADALATIQEAVRDGTWRDRCKGRDLLKSYTGEHGLNSEHFRNCLIAKMAAPPDGLAAIMSRILKA